ncbi:MAG: hypothetical protein F6K28_53275, partial [Microcoleus sp. SIO2G3]|nr:hypothetical protein [Microcoleus sp. SIO2G3]
MRQSEATNRALLNAIPDLMLRLNKDGTYLDFRGAKNFEPLISVGSELGKKVSEILPPTVAQATMYHIEQALRTGKLQIFEYQLSLQCKLYYYEARVIDCKENEV